MGYYNSKVIRRNSEAILNLDNIFKLSIIIYIFSIFFSYSSGEIIVKASRIMVFAVWGFSILSNLQGKIKFRFYYIWGALFCVYHLCLANWGAVDKSQSMEFLMSFLYAFLVNAIVLSFIIKNPEFLKTVLIAIAVCSIFGALRVFLTYGFNYYFNSRGEEINGNGIGKNCVIGALCSVYLFVCSARKSNARAIFFVLIVCNILLSVFTASRTSYVFFAVPCAVYAILNSKNKFKLIRNIIIAIVAVIIVFVLLMKVEFLYNLVGNRIESMLAGFMGEDTDDSTSTRMMLIEWGVEFFNKNKIWGFGLDGFRGLVKLYHPGYTVYYAHNNFIEMLVDGGIIGFAIYYILYLYILIGGIKNLKHKNKSLIFFLGIIIGLLICEWGMINYYTTTVQLIIMLCYYQVIIKQTVNR